MARMGAPRPPVDPPSPDAFTGEENVKLVRRIYDELDLLAHRSKTPEEDVTAKLKAAFLALAPLAERTWLAYILMDVELIGLRRHPERVNHTSGQIDTLRNRIDPAFENLSPETVRGAFRIAVKGETSPRGGAGNTAAWTVLAKLTLATGALDAKPPQEKLKPADFARAVTREANRLRQNGSRGVIPRELEWYRNFAVAASDSDAASNIYYMGRHTGADEATIQAAVVEEFEKLHPPTKTRKKK